MTCMIEHRKPVPKVIVRTGQSYGRSVWTIWLEEYDRDSGGLFATSVGLEEEVYGLNRWLQLLI